MIKFFKIIHDLRVNKQSISITGLAGAGKTHLLKRIYKELKDKHDSVVLTPTTGINTLNLGGITIHKFWL